MSIAKPSLTALYFGLTFIAGAAVGSWALWIYLIGFPSRESLPAPEPVTPPPAVSAPAVSAPAAASTPAPDEPAAADVPASSPASPPAPPAPTTKGHWNTVDVPGRSHEECLALTNELNDAYKDCRFGAHKEVWVEE